MELTQQTYSNIYCAAVITAFKNIIDICLEKKGVAPVSGILTDDQAFRLLLASANFDRVNQIGAEAKMVNRKAFPTYDVQNKAGRPYRPCYEMMLKFGKKYKDCFVKVEPKEESK